MKRAEVEQWLKWGQLEGFKEPHIREYLAKKLNDEDAAERYYKLLSKIEDLGDLSKTPRMLQFITRWSVDELRILTA